MKPDGSRKISIGTPLSHAEKQTKNKKIRAVDDETMNGVNSCVEPTERHRNDSIDARFAVVEQCGRQFHIAPLVVKADIDAAHRRSPIMPLHRWASYVAFRCDGQTTNWQHLAMAFGATVAVHAWDRVGSLLCHIARVLLKTPLLQYVDDYFAVEDEFCAQHAMECFARLVRCILGLAAISEHTLSCGRPFEILGVVADMDSQSMSCWPSCSQVQKWLQCFDKVLNDDVLSCSVAGKLAGASSWTSQRIFHRLGRAMLVPLFRRQHAFSRKGALVARSVAVGVETD